MSEVNSNPEDSGKAEPPHVIVRGNARGFLQEITSGAHHLQADEPTDKGGTGQAPDPYDYVLAGLGACTSMTIGWYARQKKIPLENIVVSLNHARIHAKDCEDCETREGMLDTIDLAIELTGAITPEQHAKLMEAAARCPVHRTLTSEIKIRLHSVNPAGGPAS